MKKIFLSAILILAFILSVTAYSRDVMNDLDSSLIRLHVIAHSDSDYDQMIKLRVRDEILNAVQDISAKDPDTFTAAAEEAANRCLEDNNIPYRAHAEYGMFQFPRKSYGNITLPAGEYNGIRVILGSGSGQNWWCIMYPPLCIQDDGSVSADGTTTEMLKSLLNNDTYELITQKGSKTEVRFRILEFINSLK